MNSRWKTLRTLIGGAAFMLPMLAQAQSTLIQRCAADVLNPAQAEARLNWARTCALTLHTGGPSSYDASGDYYEVGTPYPGYNLYLGSPDGYSGINALYVSRLYLSGVTYQGTDANGYRMWWRAASRKKPRPIFPVYGSTYYIDDPNGWQLFPHPSLSNCELYYDKAGTLPATPYGQVFFINGYCEASP